MAMTPLLDPARRDPCRIIWQSPMKGLVLAHGSRPNFFLPCLPSTILARLSLLVCSRPGIFSRTLFLVPCDSKPLPGLPLDDTVNLQERQTLFLGEAAAVIILRRDQRYPALQALYLD